MDAVLDIFHAAQVPLEYETIEIGEKVYLEVMPQVLALLHGKVF